MKLTPIAANQTSVSFNDGTEVFFSYATPVAAYLPEKGYVKTDTFYSVTTSRHINQYFQHVDENDINVVPDEYIVALVNHDVKYS